MNIRSIQFGYNYYWLCVSLSLAVFLIGCRKKDEGQSTAESQTSATGWFTEITQDAGLDFIHESGLTGKFLILEIMASGSALFDYDNDGDLDIYVTTGHKGIPEFTSDNAPRNRLYQQDSDGRPPKEKPELVIPIGAP